MPILTAPSLGPPHPLPVGRPIDRAPETGLLDEGLQHHHRMSVFGLPVPADPARDLSQDPTAQLRHPDPG